MLTTIAARVQKQIDDAAALRTTLVDDVRIDVVKVGMLASAALVETVDALLASGPLAATPVVLDPVMVSTSGSRLLSPDAVERVGSEVRLADLAGDGVADQVLELAEDHAAALIVLAVWVVQMAVPFDLLYSVTFLLGVGMQLVAARSWWRAGVPARPAWLIGVLLPIAVIFGGHWLLGAVPMAWLGLGIFGSSTALALAWCAFQMWAAHKGTLDLLTLRAVHLAFAFALAYLVFPFRKTKVPPVCRAWAK